MNDLDMVSGCWKFLGRKSVKLRSDAMADSSGFWIRGDLVYVSSMVYESMLDFARDFWLIF